MNRCDITSPYRNHKGCPGEYDASHICRACQLKKVSEKRVEHPSSRDLDRVYQCASSIR